MLGALLSEDELCVDVSIGDRDRSLEALENVSEKLPCAPSQIV